MMPIDNDSACLSILLLDEVAPWEACGLTMVAAGAKLNCSGWAFGMFRLPSPSSSCWATPIFLLPFHSKFGDWCWFISSSNPKNCFYDSEPLLAGAMPSVSCLTLSLYLRDPTESISPRFLISVSLLSGICTSICTRFSSGCP